MDLITLILSIVVGVTTGVVANLATHLFVNVVMPAYRKYVYQGIRVQGTWSLSQNQEVVDKKGLSRHWKVSATLKQQAYSISGYASAILVDEENASDIVNYEVVGHIYDRIVSFTFRVKDTSRLAHSSFLLEVTGDGAEMVGYRSFYGTKLKTIRATECVWRRGSNHTTGCKSDSPG